MRNKDMKKYQCVRMPIIEISRSLHHIAGFEASGSNLLALSSSRQCMRHMRKLALEL